MANSTVLYQCALSKDLFAKVCLWKNEVRLDVRRWIIEEGNQIPSKTQGISLTQDRFIELEQFWNFITTELDKLLAEKEEFRKKFFHLRGDIKVHLEYPFEGVNINKWVKHGKEWLPVKGVNMKPAEWKVLSEMRPTLRDFILSEDTSKK